MISVCITPRNHYRFFSGQLDALRAQLGGLDYEIIWSGGGVPDESLRELRNVLDTTKQYCILNDTRFISINSARNRAVQQASGDVLLFIDNDVIPEPGCLQRLLTQCVDMEEEIFSVPVLFDTQAVPEKMVGRIYEDRISIDLKNEEIRVRIVSGDAGIDMHSSSPGTVNFFTPNIFVCKPGVLERMGGFDGNVTALEQYDLSLRAFQAEVPVILDPQAWATLRTALPIEPEEFDYWYTARSLEDSEAPTQYVLNKWRMERCPTNAARGRTFVGDKEIWKLYQTGILPWRFLEKARPHAALTFDTRKEIYFLQRHGHGDACPVNEMGALLWEQTIAHRSGVEALHRIKVCYEDEGRFSLEEACRFLLDLEKLNLISFGVAEDG